MSGHPALEVRDLRVGYDDVDVIDGLSLAVAPGEMVALLGRNGAGKTTALAAVAGLIPIHAGTVLVDGVDVSGRSAGRRVGAGLITVPDDRGLFRSLTIAEHLRLVDGDLGEVGEWFPDLAPLGNRAAGLCSGGEQQQLAVALALVRRPRVLLVDELSMGLAPQVAETLLARIRTLVDETRMAAVVVEQFVDSVLGVAHRGMVLADGRILTDRPAAELAADHAALEAAYLG
ncbi:MAG: ATP-binding cassette domain-containing protein [Microthrixaceae bacterium]